MTRGSIVFVHGTGVRLKSYKSVFAKVREIALANGITQDFVECAWGDPLGVEFKGLSLPDGPDGQQKTRAIEEFARWRWLFDDPLFELDKLTIRDTSRIVKPIPRPGTKPDWLELWEKIESYTPSRELQLLLQRAGLEDLWPNAMLRVVKESSIPKAAFAASAHELPDVATALARALVAELHVQAMVGERPGPSPGVRLALVNRLIDDWGQRVFGLGTFLASFSKRVATNVVRHYRSSLSAGAALQVGDILLYQAHSESIHNFIRFKIANSKPPITLVAHSLGGIACVELLALPNPPIVDYLVTAGSQAPLLYEMGALRTLKPGQRLPAGFPPWLNFYDRDDFLSYIAHRLFPSVEDYECESGQPFPDSHGAYFGDEIVWRKIASFTNR